MHMGSQDAHRNAEMNHAKKHAQQLTDVKMHSMAEPAFYAKRYRTVLATHGVDDSAHKGRSQRLV